MCGECGFEVEEVEWNEWVIRSRGLVEPAGLRRIVTVRVEIRADENPLARYCGECCKVPNVE